MVKFSLNLSTYFTLLRIALTPCVVIAMKMHIWNVAFVLFVVAAFTDALDGFIARTFNQQTYVGAVLDPIADKFLLISCFFTLAFIESPLFTIPTWFVFFVVIKELLLIVGALGIYWRIGSLPIKPTRLSKGTTVCQIAFIMWLFACYFFHWVPIKTYYAMLGLLFCMVFTTFVQYIYIGYRYLRYGTI